MAWIQTTGYQGLATRRRRTRSAFDEVRRESLRVSAAAVIARQLGGHGISVSMYGRHDIIEMVSGDGVIIAHAVIAGFYAEWRLGGQRRKDAIPQSVLQEAQAHLQNALNTGKVTLPAEFECVELWLAAISHEIPRWVEKHKDVIETTAKLVRASEEIRDKDIPSTVTVNTDDPVLRKLFNGQ